MKGETKHIPTLDLVSLSLLLSNLLHVSKWCTKRIATHRGAFAVLSTHHTVHFTSLNHRKFASNFRFDFQQPMKDLV